MPEESRKRILVLDESPTAAATLRQALPASGWEVAMASHGDQALNLAASWAPDVIVSDLYVNGTDGLEFVSRVQGVDPTIPLVMTSHESDLSVVLKAVHAGVYDYVPKNGDIRVLCAAVGRAATHARAMRQNLSLQEQLRGANHELEARVVERTQQLSNANSELQRVLGQLVSTERLAAIGQLAAGVAHEINNPLSYVISNLSYVSGRIDELEVAGLAEEGRGNLGELRQALKETEDGANRIAEIVRDMRTMSRTDDRSHGKFDINAAVRSATRIAGEQIRRRAKLRLSLGQGVDVVGSVGRMTQVLVNLLVNAVDALELSAQRENEIAIVTERRENQVVVSVSDTGPGIKPDHLPRIFEPFYTTKPEGEGTGLGLSICQDIVVRHNGTIQATSALGLGATFIITMPLAPAGALRSTFT